MVNAIIFKILMVVSFSSIINFGSAPCQTPPYCETMQDFIDLEYYGANTPCERTITDEEYDLLLRVCMSECGGEYGEPIDGKIAVVETVLNRCDMYGMTIEEVLHEPNQYSLADNGEPDYTVVHAVDCALSERTYPENMIYFRTEHYHNFGTPYKNIGNHYFSLEE